MFNPDLLLRTSGNIDNIVLKVWKFYRTFIEVLYVRVKIFEYNHVYFSLKYLKIIENYNFVSLNTIRNRNHFLSQVTELLLLSQIVMKIKKKKNNK